MYNTCQRAALDDAASESASITAVDSEASEATQPETGAAPTVTAQGGNCAWTEEDELELLKYMKSYVSKAGDGKSFKAAQMNGAAAHVNQFRTKGAPKMGKSVGYKVQSVSLFLT